MWYYINDMKTGAIVTVLSCCIALVFLSIYEGACGHCDHYDCTLCIHTCNIALLCLSTAVVGLMYFGTVSYVVPRYELQLASTFFHPPKL